MRSPEQRDKLENWLLRTVLSLGPADDSMDVVYIGTILHYDSVLARTLKKPQWRGKTFRAVERMPDRLDLWELWERIYKVPPDGPDKARAFYDGNREKMNAGAVVSWPTFRPLYTLMCKRAENRAAFDAEQQNDPLVATPRPSPGSWSTGRNCPPACCTRGLRSQSGQGRAGRDPSALLVGGLDRENMRLYEVEADIRKRHPDRIIQDLIALQRRWRCLMWAVETVQFQEFFADVLVREAVRQGLPLPVSPLKNSTDKLLRIESLHPYFCQGRILLNPDSHVLIDQLRHFPMADHDDGPDALEMLWRTATQGFVSLQDAFIRVPRAPGILGGVLGTDDDDDFNGPSGGQRWN